MRRPANCCCMPCQAAYAGKLLSARACYTQVRLTPGVIDIISTDGNWQPHQHLPINCALSRMYVHGDAQKSNVMLRYNDDEAAAPAEVRLIDMDWSGKAGVDRYLFRPNPMLGRPWDVKCGAVMTQQHDLDTWDASWFYL